MSNKKCLATITILIKDRQTHAQDVQKILSDYGHFIIARMGVNVQRSCIEHCTGLITIMVEGSKEDIEQLTAKFDDLYGVVAKFIIMTD